MFLFESIPWYSVLMWFAVLIALIIVNELARMNRWFSLLLFVALPAALTFMVWPKTAGEGSSVGSTYHWVRVYLVLAVCLFFMAARFTGMFAKNRFMLVLFPVILVVSILMAVVQEFQYFNFKGTADGIMIAGGPWNIMNAITGLICIITISGWSGIMLSRDDKKDLLWPDMLWFWIIAYDLWNFAYLYNCVSGHAFYAGAALLISSTLPAFFIKKGAWIQHRAQTAAIWLMFLMTFPAFVDSSMFTVRSSQNVAALYVMSSLALAANLGALVYHLYRIFRYRINPVKDEVYSTLPQFKEVKFGHYESDEEPYFSFGYYGNTAFRHR